MTVLPINNGLDAAGSPKRAGFVLGRRASLAVSAGVAAHTLWTSAAPALTYRLYAQEWHLNYTATTAIFAVYPIAVVAMLVGFGGRGQSYALDKCRAGTNLRALCPGMASHPYGDGGNLRRLSD